MSDNNVTKTQAWLSRRSACTMNNYGSPAIVLERGQGSLVWDVDGKCYIDLISGIAVNCLGHNHPKLVKALGEQAARMIHVSNLYGIPGQIELAEALTSHSAMDKAFFCNSGAEAIEGALKLARQYARQKGYNERFGFVCMKNSFHGRTMGALTATGQMKYHHNFDPLVPGFVYADFNDLDSVKKAITKDTCGIVAEPIQGEGGILPAEPAFLEGLRQLCDENDLTLIFDEVQTGMGRTGKTFAHEHYGVAPDVMALAKGLGGGVAIGATLARGVHADTFGPGMHASTFGGNPLACAAALVVCSELFDGGLLEKVAQMGQWLEGRLQEMVKRHAVLVEARGKGLMWGLVMDGEHPEVVGLMKDGGVLGNVTAGKVIRIAPALNIGQDELDKALKVMDEALSKLG